ncbi:hypothetical protein COJ48_13740 [Bacillus cereus]|nr:hypothetical protein COJ48_13740 [Bacillus cereus]PGP79237.1 hypothetical protein CN997_18585 [Bacillus cereus]
MHEHLGEIIKLKRIEQEVLQEELCSGICTPSYLSRIENKRVIANEEIYKLLFNKLGINYKDMLKDNSEQDLKLEVLYQQMVLNNSYVENIQPLLELICTLNENIKIKANIIYCRHLLICGKVQESRRKLKDIGKTLKIEHNRNSYLFVNTYMIQNYNDGKCKEAIKLGLKLMKLNNFEELGREYELGIFYYNLALNYRRINNFKKSKLFVQKALDIFNNQYQLEHSLKCLILLGISYNNLNDWKEAIGIYKKALQVLEFISEDKRSRYINIIYNNLAYCYECSGGYEQALKYYKRCVQCECEENNIVTYINLIRTYYVLYDYKTAYFYLNKALDLKNEKTEKRYLLQLEILSIILENDKSSVQGIIKLQKMSIDYFLSNGMGLLAIFYCKVFAELYEKSSTYKQASLMYKKALEVTEDLRKEGGDMI